MHFNIRELFAGSLELRHNPHVRAYFTRHAIDRLMDRYGMVLTAEEIQAILAAVQPELTEEEGTLQIDITLATRPEEYRLVVVMPKGAIVTVTRTTKRDRSTVYKKRGKEMAKARPAYIDQCHHDQKGMTRRLRSGK